VRGVAGTSRPCSSTSVRRPCRPFAARRRLDAAVVVGRAGGAVVAPTRSPVERQRRPPHVPARPTEVPAGRRVRARRRTGGVLSPTPRTAGSGGGGPGALRSRRKSGVGMRWRRKNATAVVGGRRRHVGSSVGIGHGRSLCDCKPHTDTPHTDYIGRRNDKRRYADNFSFNFLVIHTRTPV